MVVDRMGFWKVGGNLHSPPIANGMVNRTFVLNSFQKWNAVMAKKMIVKITDAAIEGT
jgi:hypothetical protein